MPSSYVEVVVNADRKLIERLIGIFSQLGFEGFWEDGSALKCYISRARWSPAMLEEVHVTISRMAHSSSTPRPKVVVRNIEDRKWNEEWEKTIKPIQVTDRIVIKPTWQEYSPAPGQIIITIDPKMSFGTGYHESTRLVLKMLEKYIQPGMSLLDVGTGTGVLAIGGVKLGASSAVGVDIEDWAYENAVENVRLNSVEGRVTVLQGELTSVPGGKFDMIVANIQLNVIVPMLREMKERLTVKGVLILSGLLIPDREGIMNALSALGLQVCEEMNENEWMAIVARWQNTSPMS